VARGKQLHVAAKGVNVAVNHVVRTLLSEDPVKLPGVAKRLRRREAGENLGASRSRPLVVGSSGVRADEEIHLHPGRVNPLQQIDQPRLDAALIEVPNHVEHFDWPIRAHHHANPSMISAAFAGFAMADQRRTPRPRS
jgi:hypothetical protein